MYEAVLAQADYEESLTHRRTKVRSNSRQKNAFFIEKSDALLLLYDPEMEGSPKYSRREAENAVKQTDIRFIRLRWMISVPPLKKKISLHNTSENI